MLLAYTVKLFNSLLHFSQLLALLFNYSSVLEGEG
jgi:hypothetical protein